MQWDANLTNIPSINSLNLFVQVSMAVQSTPAGFSGSENKAYSLLSVMTGHIGPITCVTATDDGKVASGGVDGVRLWNLRTATELARPSGAGQRGATTALAWIQREDEPDDGLVYGTANGYLVCWKETRGSEDLASFQETYCVKIAKPTEVTGIAFEAGSNRLAIANRNSVVQLFLINSRMQLNHVFTVIINNHVPKAIAFRQTSGEHKDILTFGLYDGQIHILQGSNGEIQQTRNTGCNIGNAAINARRGVFCIDDPLQGVALYRLDSGARIRTYPVAVKKSSKPRQVTFAEDCSVILCGSDHGTVYVFDRRSGDVVDKLKIGNDRIQATTAVEMNETKFVLAAISQGNTEASDILVWQKNIDKRVQQKATEILETWDALKMVVYVSLCVASLAVVFQNLSVRVHLLHKTSVNEPSQINASIVEKAMDYLRLI
ncbi:hypothetical protein Hypma_014539 [Hypsizygus marmoreus]|uniref:WD40 repeat-like protein n=1 Tax=Hypsizygus marmoreus TaxID=39966 RepID=A0A369JGM0_HYPMA|nr:hypothetical protein Hypma_014539 [Hypsizygus marmoreus]